MSVAKGNLILNADGTATGGGALFSVYSKLLNVGGLANAPSGATANPAVDLSQKQTLYDQVQAVVSLMDWIQDGNTDSRINVSGLATGGGFVSSNPTITVTPGEDADIQPLGAVAFAGTSIRAARADHVHPASDTGLTFADGTYNNEALTWDSGSSSWGPTVDGVIAAAVINPLPTATDVYFFNNSQIAGIFNGNAMLLSDESGSSQLNVIAAFFADTSIRHVVSARYDSTHGPCLGFFLEAGGPAGGVEQTKQTVTGRTDREIAVSTVAALAQYGLVFDTHTVSDGGTQTIDLSGQSAANSVSLTYNYTPGGSYTLVIGQMTVTPSSSTDTVLFELRRDDMLLTGYIAANVRMTGAVCHATLVGIDTGSRGSMQTYRIRATNQTGGHTVTAAIGESSLFLRDF